MNLWNLLEGFCWPLWQFQTSRRVYKSRPSHCKYRLRLLEMCLLSGPNWGSQPKDPKRIHQEKHLNISFGTKPNQVLLPYSLTPDLNSTQPPIKICPPHPLTLSLRLVYTSSASVTFEPVKKSPLVIMKPCKSVLTSFPRTWSPRCSHWLQLQ